MKLACEWSFPSETSNCDVYKPEIRVPPGPSVSPGRRSGRHGPGWQEQHQAGKVGPQNPGKYGKEGQRQVWGLVPDMDPEGLPELFRKAEWEAGDRKAVVKPGRGSAIHTSSINSLSFYYVPGAGYTLMTER